MARQTLALKHRLACGLIACLPLFSNAADTSITTQPGREYQATIAAQHIAYVGESQNNPDIFLQSLKSSGALPRRLTDHPGVDREPALADGAAPGLRN